MNGKVVQHEAAVFYQHLASGYVYGPMQIQKAALTVTAPPKSHFERG